MSTLATKPGLQNLTAEMFRSAVGRAFTFRRPAGQESVSGGVVELRLAEVKSFGSAARVAGPAQSGPLSFRVPFSLLFELPEGTPPLGAGLHHLEDPGFLAEDWYIARVHVLGGDPKKAYYEAVFG